MSQAMAASWARRKAASQQQSAQSVIEPEIRRLIQASENIGRIKLKQELLQFLGEK